MSAGAYLFRRVFGQLCKEHGQSMGYTLRAVKPSHSPKCTSGLPPTPWAFAVLKSRHLQLTLYHPTHLDIQQAYTFTFDVYRGQHRLLVNQQVLDVHAAPFGFTLDVYAPPDALWQPPDHCLQAVATRL